MMEKVTLRLFGKDMLDLMSEMISEFVGSKYDEMRIYESIKDINESIRMGLYLVALDFNNGELAYTINRINKRLSDERIINFKKSIENNKEKNFLANLSKADKRSLLVDLNIDVDEDELYKLSELDRKYYDCILNSILNDQEVDCRDGIDRFMKYRKGI